MAVSRIDILSDVCPCNIHVGSRLIYCYRLSVESTRNVIIIYNRAKMFCLDDYIDFVLALLPKKKKKKKKH